MYLILGKSRSQNFLIVNNFLTCTDSIVLEGVKREVMCDTKNYKKKTEDLHLTNEINLLVYGIFYINLKIQKNV